MKKYYKIVISVSILLVLGFIFIPENGKKEEIPVEISAATSAERINYFALHGWETEEIFSKNIVIPSDFSDSYESFAQLQDKQNMPLRKHKGESATLYTYRVTNYEPDGKKLLAELIVCNDKAVSAIIYAEDDISYMLTVN